MPRPASTEYNIFYQPYVDKVQGDDVVAILEASLPQLDHWLQSLAGRDISFRYAPGKWTIGQVLQHMIDTERVFSYRAMSIGRGETQPLPGFDEIKYADEAPAAQRKLKGLAEELTTLRKASIILFRSLSRENVLHRIGTASEFPVSVNALGFLLVGHVLHHIHIIETRYHHPYPK